MSLKVSAVGNQNNISFQRPKAAQAQTTTQQSADTQTYQNPVNKGWEYFAALTPPVLGSLALGTAAVFASRYGGIAKGYSWAIGAATAVVAGLVTIPTAWYHASVNVFGKQKEMGVYSRKAEVRTVLAERVHDSAKTNDLDTALRHNMMNNMGERGTGINLMQTQIPQPSAN